MSRPVALRRYHAGLIQLENGDEVLKRLSSLKTEKAAIKAARSYAATWRHVSAYAFTEDGGIRQFMFDASTNTVREVR